MPVHSLRIGQIIGSTILDANGVAIGHVHDVRLRRTGPEIPGFGPALQIDGLVAGRSSLARRLGLDRTDITGPWPINTYGRRAARRAKFIPWDTVTFGDGTLRTTMTAAEAESAV